MNGGLLALPGYSTVQWSAGNAPSFYQMNQDGGVASQTPYSWGTISDPDLKTIGWTGGSPYQKVVDPNDPMGSQLNEAGNGAFTPEFQKYLQDKGLTLRVGQGESGYASQLYDANGNPVGEGSKFGGGSEGDIFGSAFGTAAGLLGAGIATGVGGFGAVPSDVLAGADIGSAYGGVPEGAQWTSAAAGDGTAGDIGANGLANAGSDAHFLTNPGDLGNIGGASGGAATLPSVNVSPGLLSQLQSGDVLGALKSAGGGLADWATANPGQALKAGTLLAGLLGSAIASKGSNAPAAYTPKAMANPGWSPSVKAQFSPVQQQTGLLSVPQGQARAGLWRYAGAGMPNAGMAAQQPGLLGGMRTIGTPSQGIG